MINKSESIKELATALVKFHGEMGKVAKDKVNPFFKSKYADLSVILTAIKEPLLNAGLAVTQLPVGENQLSTLLMHGPSGEWIEATYAMAPVKADPQGLGSVITYQRRYALGAVLQLNIDEDDDGNAASQPEAKAAPRAAAKAPTRGRPVEDVLCSKHGNTVLAYSAGVKPNGEKYDAFMSCSEKDADGKWCKAYLVNQDHQRLTRDPETGKYFAVEAVMAGKETR